MNEHGGKRKGAGRKLAPKGTTKVPYSTKLSPQIVAYLRTECANAAKTIELAIKQTERFQDWQEVNFPES